MALTKLEEWSETPASNIDVGGIGLSDATQIDALDNIEREHMSQVAKWLGDDTLASAATTDLGSVPGRYVSVTGTTTITALGTIKAGTIKYVKFTGALTLTHNATSLILPGASNLITEAGDVAILVSEGSGNWRCLSFQRASGASIDLNAQTSIVSAATTDIGSVKSESVLITGTTTITSLGTAPAGTYRKLTFSGALTLTYNGTSLLLPGGVDILTASDDFALAYSAGSGNWAIRSYQRASALSEPISKAAAGIGNVSLFAGGAGAQWTLPATGSYEYFGFRMDSTGLIQSVIAGVAAGSTVVGAGAGSDVWRGSYKRLT